MPGTRTVPLPTGLPLIKIVAVLPFNVVARCVHWFRGNCCEDPTRLLFPLVKTPIFG